MNPTRKVLFLGQKPLGEAAWERLKRAEGAGYRIAAACSNGSADAVWWRSSGVRESCAGLPFIDNAERNEALLVEAIRRHGVDTIICVQHPWILSREVLASVDYNALNLHCARLPDYRGYNAVNHAILNRDETYACSLHWMSEEVDRGALAFEAVFDIEPQDTAVSLYAKSYLAGLRLFDELLSRLAGFERIPRRPVAGAGRFYSRKSIEPLREIKDPLAEDAALKARAFFFPPFEPAFVRRGDAKLYVLPPALREAGFEARDAGAWLALAGELGKDFRCEVR